MDKFREYLEKKLEYLDLEELFESLDLEPVEVILLLHKLGKIDIGYYMDDEFIEEKEDYDG